MGSVVMQAPCFRELGLNLEGFHLATINVDISPCEFEMANPSHRFERVVWNPDAPPETFSFSPCRLEHEDCLHDGYVYYPHPETKTRDFHSQSILEIISSYIEAIEHGKAVRVYLRPGEIVLKRPIA